MRFVHEDTGVVVVVDETTAATLSNKWTPQTTAEPVGEDVEVEPVNAGETDESEGVEPGDSEPVESESTTGTTGKSKTRSTSKKG